MNNTAYYKPTFLLFALYYFIDYTTSYSQDPHYNQMMKEYQELIKESIQTSSNVPEHYTHWHYLSSGILWNLMFLCSAILLGIISMVYLQPMWFMRILIRYSHPTVFWGVNTKIPICSLTIDDAPSKSTPAILDLLLQYNVKATFFIISNQIRGNEAILRRIIAEGHILGNHLTEDKPSIRDSLSDFEAKLKECHQAIQPYNDGAIHVKNINVKTSLLSKIQPDGNLKDKPDQQKCKKERVRWLRPASGWFTSRMREIAEQHGYKICLGSVYPHDAQIKIERINAWHLKWRTQCGSILIVHDRVWTIGVLKQALPSLTRRFQFVSLEELHGYSTKS